MTIRRFKVLRVADTFLPRLLGVGSHRYEVVEGPLPPDARVVGARLESGLQAGRTEVVLLVESDSFDPIHESEDVPELIPWLKDLRDEGPQAQADAPEGPGG